jgi:hypothetical protein
MGLKGAPHVFFSARNRGAGSLAVRQIPKREFVGGELPAVGLGDRPFQDGMTKPGESRPLVMVFASVSDGFKDDGTC